MRNSATSDSGTLSITVLDLYGEREKALRAGGLGDAVARVDETVFGLLKPLILVVVCADDLVETDVMMVLSKLAVSN